MPTQIASQRSLPPRIPRRMAVRRRESRSQRTSDPPDLDDRRPLPAAAPAHEVDDADDDDGDHRAGGQSDRAGLVRRLVDVALELAELRLDVLAGDLGGL